MNNFSRLLLNLLSYLWATWEICIFYINRTICFYYLFNETYFSITVVIKKRTFMTYSRLWSKALDIQLNNPLIHPLFFMIYIYLKTKLTPKVNCIKQKYSLVGCSELLRTNLRLGLVHYKNFYTTGNAFARANRTSGDRLLVCIFQINKCSLS